MLQIVVVIISTVLVAAFFSGSETAFLSSNKLRIELEKKKGLFASRIISGFIRKPNRLLATILVGSNIALVVFSFAMANLLNPLLHIFTQNEALALVLNALISSTIFLLLADFIPKAIFRAVPNQALNFIAIPLKIFYIILFPISQLIVLLSDFLQKVFNKKHYIKSNPGNIFEKIDLENLINEVKPENESQEEIQHELRIFQNVLEFSNVKVKACYIPRNEIIAIDVEKPLSDLHEKFVETGYSKILVYEENIDRIIGYFQSLDLFKKPESIRSKLRPIMIVPESMSAKNLLSTFIQQNKNVAVVVDEVGGTAGMVTIEDIIEEIFGEISDEHDREDLIEKQLSENEFIFAGRLEIDYLNQKYNIELPFEAGYETLNGLLLHHHKDIPKINQEITIANFRIRVLKATQTRTELVSVVIL